MSFDCSDLAGIAGKCVSWTCTRTHATTRRISVLFADAYQATILMTVPAETLFTGHYIQITSSFFLSLSLILGWHWIKIKLKKQSNTFVCPDCHVFVVIFAVFAIIIITVVADVDRRTTAHRLASASTLKTMESRYDAKLLACCANMHAEMTLN